MAREAEGECVVHASGCAKPLIVVVAGRLRAAWRPVRTVSYTRQVRVGRGLRGVTKSDQNCLVMGESGANKTEKTSNSGIKRLKGRLQSLPHDDGHLPRWTPNRLARAPSPLIPEYNTTARESQDAPHLSGQAFPLLRPYS